MSLAQADLHRFRHLLVSIAEEMGLALAQSAVSPNIKERLDFSCALLGPDGCLVAHAAHIPVHLGSAHMTVGAVRSSLKVAPGDVVILNHPQYGGTHLNDITLVAPVHRGRHLLGWVLNRAHHADVGGREPGSMVGATTLTEEGVVIEPTILVRRGRLLRSVQERLLRPMRATADREGDLAAQLAAIRTGSSRLLALAERQGTADLLRAQEAIVEHGSRTVRALLRSIPDGVGSAALHLDGPGTPRLALELRKKGDRLLLDFTESDAASPGSWNTHRAVVWSAVFYLLKALGGEELPETSGALEPIDLRLGERTLLSAGRDDGVAVGNVETSQRIVDILIEALRPLLPGKLPALSQGTMNNLLLGGDGLDGTPFVYYETIGGGAGAGPQGDGASMLQTHMTNTRNTPTELLESELPLRVIRVSRRSGSGGPGRHRGGDGVVRILEVLAPMRASLVASRRHEPATGADGGGVGRCGRDAIIRKGGRAEPWDGSPVDLLPHDRIRIDTPGGGGWQKKGPAS